MNREPPWVGSVLDFWFRELEPDQWFANDAALDDRIRKDFVEVHRLIARGDVGKLSDARSLLAAIIIVDQFSRNMFRGTPDAFATDPLARQLAEQVLAQGLDQAMTPAERYFIYLPFEHSEDRVHQALAVRLIGSLGDESWTRYARTHQAAILRFGRFPHRNGVLGRKSTDAEVAYLADSDGSY